MLRLTGSKLPLDHPPESIAVEAVARLWIAPDELASYTISRRAHDARKYPAGAGAGYAGGILLAGADCIKTAEAVARSPLPS